MNILAFLRQFHVFGYAIFDLVAAFSGIYFARNFLSRTFRKVHIEIPTKNWIYLTLPIGLLIHLCIGQMTPMTKDFISTTNHYPLKIVVVGLVVLGLRNIKRIPKK